METCPPPFTVRKTVMGEPWKHYPLSSVHRGFIAGQYGVVQPWDLYTIAKSSRSFVQRLKKYKILEGHHGCVNTVSWSERGTFLLTGSDDYQLNIYDTYSTRMVHSIDSGHRANVFSAKFLPCTSDLKIVSCSGDGMLHYNELGTTYGENPFNCHSGTTYEVLVTPGDPNTFLSCGEDGTVRLFDLRAKTKCNCQECSEDILVDAKHAVTTISLNPMLPYHLAIGCKDSYVRVFDRRTLGTSEGTRSVNRNKGWMPGLFSKFRPTNLKKDSSCRITSLQYSDDGSDVLVSYCTDYVYLFNVRDQDGKVMDYAGTITGAEKNGHHTNGEEGSDGCPTADLPPVKRLRLRGDWSDTGPNARPETEEEMTPETNLMHRMSELFSRWIENAMSTTIHTASSSSDEDQGEEEGVQDTQLSPSYFMEDEEYAGENTSTANNANTTPSHQQEILQQRQNGEVDAMETDLTHDQLEDTLNNNIECAKSCFPGNDSSGCSGSSSRCTDDQNNGSTFAVSESTLENSEAASGNVFTESGRRNVRLTETNTNNLQTCAGTSTGGQQQQVVACQNEEVGGISSQNSPLNSEQSSTDARQQSDVNLGHENRNKQECLRIKNQASSSSRSSITRTNYPTSSDPPALNHENNPNSNRHHEASSGTNINPSNQFRHRVEAVYSSANRYTVQRQQAASKIQSFIRMHKGKKDQQRQEITDSTKRPDLVYMPEQKMLYRGHRNSRTMIKEANFWGEDYVLSGSDCGRIFIWDRHTGELVMLLEGDRHVVNCVQPHPYDPILATSGIDHDIKLWTPLLDEPADMSNMDEIVQRNEKMLEESRDTITVPAAFVLRMFASLGSIRRNRQRNQNLSEDEAE